MKKAVTAILVFALCLCCFVGCGDSKASNLNEFYDKVVASQELLDSVADDIYSNWYDAIYEDEFNEDIDLAIASAMVDHEDDLDQIETLESEITQLFKSLKDDPQNGYLVKDVMSAYSDYYEFVVNVSGSFKSFSADKETLKKELASTLKDLSYEL